MRILYFDSLKTAELKKRQLPTRILWTLVCLSITIGLSSCDWYIFKPKQYSGDETPRICTDVFDHPPVTYEKLKPYSIEELLILQKCGLAYSPEHQLSWYIANQNEYPVPALVKHLRSNDDEYFKYHLILDFVSLTESEKFRERVLSDRALILVSVRDAINKMNDKEIKKLSENEFHNIQTFFDGS